jgi:hypothetical protein
MFHADPDPALDITLVACDDGAFFVGSPRIVVTAIVAIG